MNEDLVYKVALSKVPFIGIVMARKLIEQCGSAKAIFSAPKKDLLKIPRLSDKIATSIREADPLSLSQPIIQYTQKNNIEILFFTDEKYPNRLKHYADSPILLYYRGNVNLNADRIVSIIGTRQPSDYGKRICEQLVEGLSSYGTTIISGLAYGIDVIAHQKCISLQIPTIGILGHGLKYMYPSKHKKVADQMLSCGGILTQFAPDKAPIREHFPMRNKIIAGMSDAVIVVETSRKGGSMITVEMANAYNKDVFSVPGRLTDPKSLGNNFLIKSHKAQLIETAQDVAYVMRWGKANVESDQQMSLFLDLNDEEKKIINYIQEKGEIHIDELIYQTNFKNSKIATLLLELEFKGAIKSLPGKMFAIT